MGLHLLRAVRSDDDGRGVTGIGQPHRHPVVVGSDPAENGGAERGIRYGLEGLPRGIG
jgi:hypothetical protein